VRCDVRDAVPPEFVWADSKQDKVNSYLRFKSLYMNENRLDQPDLILDIILRAVADVPTSATVGVAPTSEADGEVR
jgi:hypothetical protein